MSAHVLAGLNRSIKCSETTSHKIENIAVANSVTYSPVAKCWAFENFSTKFFLLLGVDHKPEKRTYCKTHAQITHHITVEETLAKFFGAGRPLPQSGVNEDRAGPAF